MAVMTLIWLAGMFCIVTSSGEIATNSDPPNPEYQPNWGLLVGIFVASSAVAAIVGVVALLKPPVIPELPEFREPTSHHNPLFAAESGMWPHNDAGATSYNEYPLGNDHESYPMEALPSHRSIPPSPRAPSQASGYFPSQNYQPMYPPITVMTQRM